MDVSLSTSTNLARDAVTPQTSANAGQNAAPPSATPLETATAVLSPAQATLVQLLSDAVRNATALQGGLAALLPDLVQAQSIVVVPAEVRTAIANVIDTTSQLQALPSDAEITNALLKSGNSLPTSSQTPTSPLPPSILPAPSDIRVSLQSLQQAIQNWAPEGVPHSQAQAPPISMQALADTAAGHPDTIQNTAQPAGASALPVNATQSTQLPATQPTLPIPVGASTVPAGSSQPEQTAALVPSPQQIQQLLQAAQNGVSPLFLAMPQIQAQAAQVSEIGDAMASLLLLQQSARSVTQAAMRPRAAAARPDDITPGKAGNAPGTDTGLQYRRAQGQAPLPPITRWPSNPDAAFVARTLANRTENALTQVKLLEVATQMQRTEDKPQQAAQQEPRWAFDIPFQTPQGQSSAHFEIDRDLYKARSGKDARVWRVRFSINVEPLGPIHAQIAVMGKNAWVSIMAEREASMRTLEAQQQSLLQGFGAEDIAAEVICGVGKAPARASATYAGKLLDSAI